MTEKSKDDFAEKIRQFHNEWADDGWSEDGWTGFELSEEATKEALSLAITICLKIADQDAKIKKELLNNSPLWPTLFVSWDNFKWIRTEKNRGCPDEIEAIIKELGTKVGDKWPRGKDDVLGKIIKLTLERMNLCPVADLGKMAKEDSAFKIVIPEGFGMGDKFGHALSCDSLKIFFLTRYKKEDKRIQREWAKIIFDCAIWAPKESSMALNLFRAESSYVREEGMILDEIPWESDYHKQSPFLFSAFYSCLNPLYSKSRRMNLRADDEVSDKYLRGQIVEAIMKRLDSILG